MIRFVLIVALSATLTYGGIVSGSISVLEKALKASKLLPKQLGKEIRWTSNLSMKEHFLRRYREIRLSTKTPTELSRLTLKQWKKMVDFSYLRVLGGKGLIFFNHKRKVFILIDKEYKRKIILTLEGKIITSYTYVGKLKEFGKFKKLNKLPLLLEEKGLETVIPFL